jgi:methylthioribulose-1-phosphate dehydratase
MSAVPYNPARLQELAQELVANVRELSQAGWTPATSSNFSQRLDGGHAAISVSGRDKGRLTEDDIMVVDLDGGSFGSGRCATVATRVRGNETPKAY